MTEQTAEEKAAADAKAKAEAAKDPNLLRIEALERENAGLLKETLFKKEQIRDLETKKTAEEAERLKEQNKYKELYEADQPRIKRLAEIEPVLTSLLDVEIAGIPEDKRDLVPNFERPEQKLLWVKTAKEKKLFTPELNEGKPQVDKNGKPVLDAKGQPVITSVQSKVNTDKNLPEFVSWASNDPRLTTLPTADYIVWKQHNTKSSPGIRGWGNSQ